jgi:hypothetical protein
MRLMLVLCIGVGIQVTSTQYCPYWKYYGIAAPNRQLACQHASELPAVVTQVFSGTYPTTLLESRLISEWQWQCYGLFLKIFVNPYITKEAVQNQVLEIKKFLAEAIGG